MAWDSEALALEVAEEFGNTADMVHGIAWGDSGRNGPPTAVALHGWFDPSKVIELRPERFLLCAHCGTFVEGERTRWSWTLYCSKNCTTKAYKRRRRLDPVRGPVYRERERQKHRRLRAAHGGSTPAQQRWNADPARAEERRERKRQMHLKHVRNYKQRKREERNAQSRAAETQTQDDRGERPAHPGG